MKKNLLLLPLSLMAFAAAGHHQHHEGMAMPMDSAMNGSMPMTNYGFTMDPAMGGMTMRGMSHAGGRMNRAHP